MCFCGYGQRAKKIREKNMTKDTKTVVVNFRI